MTETLHSSGAPSPRRSVLARSMAAYAPDNGPDVFIAEDDAAAADETFDVVIEIAEDCGGEDDLDDYDMAADEKALLRLEKPGFLALTGRVLATHHPAFPRPGISLGNELP